MHISAFGAALRTPDLRKKILFTLGLLGLYRLGAVLPTPGVDYAAIQRCIDVVQDNSVYALINLFSGGALLQLSVFALGIMPYITASIILQLLTVVIPRLETLKKDGQAGQAKITQYTRYVTIGLAVLQSTAILSLARTPGALFSGCNETIIPNQGIWVILVMVIVMTAGTAVVMWFGELITERGVGNGMSVLIFTAIIATIPAQFAGILGGRGTFTFTVTVLVGLAVIAFVVFVDKPSGASPCSTPSAWLAVACTAEHRRSAEGEHGRRHSGHLRVVSVVPADPVRAVDGEPGVGQWVQQNFERAQERGTCSPISCW